MLTAPNNATYVSSDSITKMIQMISDHISQPLKKANYTFYSDEMMHISIEKFSVYATFSYNNVVSEHFNGLIPISKEVGSSLSAIIYEINYFMLCLDRRFNERKEAEYGCLYVA